MAAVAIGLWCLSPNPGYTQSDAWPTTGSWIEMLNSGSTLTTSALPVAPEPDRYQGQIPLRSHFTRSDGDGRLFFFGVDGNVYDKDGYLIADGSQVPGCTECLHPGCMEFQAVPVPGSCDLFYLIRTSGQSESVLGAQVHISILDLSAENPRWPGRFGRVWQAGDVPSGHPLENWFLTSNPGPGGYSVLLGTGSEFQKGSVPIVRVIDPTGTGDQLFMYSIFGNYVYTHRITSTGIVAVNTNYNGRMKIHVTNTPGVDRSQSCDADAAIGPNGEIMLTVAGPSLYKWLPATDQLVASYPLLIFRFNATTGALIDISGHLKLDESPSPDFNTNAVPVGVPQNTVRTGLKGCSIVDGGNKILLTGWEKIGSDAYPSIGLWDLATEQWTDLVDQFGITDVIGLVNVRLHRNAFPGTGEESIFFPKPNGLAALKSTEDIGQLDFVPNVDLSGTISVPPYTPPAGLGSGVEAPVRFLNAEITTDTYAERFADVDGACCDFRTAITARPGMTITQNTLWTATNNPFGNASTVTFAQDLVVASGATLTINGITVQFAPQAKLVVSRGARLNGNNSTFTSSCVRWPGIRVEGNTSNTYQGNHPGLPQDAEQGQAHLDHCTVENARYGVWCARETFEDVPDAAYYGGFVRALYSTFRNCITGVHISDYHRFDGNNPGTGPELPNRSLLAGCFFLTNEDWPGGAPVAMGVIQDVRHVRFFNCNFANEAPQLFPPDQTGTGLFLFDALVYVDGSGNPAQSYFRNFNKAVFNASGQFNPVRVQEMHFENNVYGIFDLGTSFAEYGHNTFLVPDQGTAPERRVGMYLWESKEFIIEENTFEGVGQEESVGIYFYGQQASPKGSAPPEDWTYDEERIYNNTFSNLKAGTVVDGLHRGNAQTSVDFGLQLLCGDYTDNTMDVALNARSLVRPNQGIVEDDGDDNRLAGNRYFTADCPSELNDWIFDDDWHEVEGYWGMVVNYKRHQLPNDIVDVSCPNEEDLNDLPIPFSGEFSKTLHCANGVYPMLQGNLGARRTAYNQARSLLTAAIDAFNGTVDLGQTPNLVEAIQQQNPSLSSAYLRDLLLSKHPLSDEVLQMVIAREVPLDPWHLTQVLLQNSPLSTGVWRMVQSEEVLPSFFEGMVEAAQQGGGLTLKQALELEISERRLQLAENRHVLGALYARDTVDTPLDSLTGIWLYDKDPGNAARRLEALIRLGQYSQAQALLNSTMANHMGKEIYQDLLTMHSATGGDWALLSSSDRIALQDHAGSGRTGAAWAAAILSSIREEVPALPVRFPVHTKSRRASGTRLPTGNALLTAIACYPNPTSGNTFVTYPSYLDGSTMLLTDSKGALVKAWTLRGAGVMDVGTVELPDGLYLMSIAGTAYSTKLTVQH